MDILEIRRENLRRWIEKHGTPPKERSLFSQLKADGSFGERVARRLEEQYKMGAGYLDRDPSATRAIEGAVEQRNAEPSEEAGRLTGEFLALAAEMIETYRLASPTDRQRIDLAFSEARARIGEADQAKPSAG